ncbi:type II toxin-antitoxin system YoeB family toxin [Treponema endosymbiont of Eucomonympha sp.]|uniref:type II toxin-antitoxin system YoeB family toxin n=1 Tax=Treponema endosymbiont of Eucomonympha sp. TaxID=1580831 RepID=UPI000783A8DE|nr:type II toxin-antitoxin system YoeB family toxin [Treponema endosymbiont of Eucomonympha sp.]
MAGNVRFTRTADKQFLLWQKSSRKVAEKIGELLNDIIAGGSKGNPERLKADRALFSRRIDRKNRLVYSVDENKDIAVLWCKGHYED